MRIENSGWRAILALLTFLSVISSVAGLGVDILSYELSQDGLKDDCTIVTNGQEVRGRRQDLTLISCPQLDRYDVYLTEMLTNTTLADIKNEIQGEDDTTNEDDDEIDWIRVMSKTDLAEIVLAKKSNELSTDNKDSIIVVFRNETAEDPTNTYSVMRYMKHWTGWIQEDHVFDFQTDSSIDQFYLFDDYALYLTDDKLDFKALWFRDIDSSDWIVTNDYQRTVYNKFELDQSTCEACALLDISEGQIAGGQWRFVCQVKTAGALLFKLFSIEVNWQAKNGNFQEITEGVNSIFYQSSQEIDVLTASENFFILGCATCSSTNGNFGHLKIIDPENLNILFEVNGDQESRNLGKSVSTNANSVFSDQIWYTTTDGSQKYQSFHSILAYLNQTSSKWGFSRRSDEVFGYSLEGGSGDYTVFTTDIRNVYYKSNSATSFYTFQSCPMNEIYTIEDDDDDSSDDWTTRKCEKCRFSEPFSYGFNADVCNTCSEIEQSIGVFDEYVTFFYDAACVIDDGSGEDTDDSGDQDNNTDTGEEQVDEDGNVIEEEEEEADDSAGVIIIIVVIIVLIVLGGYLFYKFYIVPKRMEKMLQQTGSGPVLGKSRRRQDGQGSKKKSADGSSQGSHKKGKKSKGGTEMKNFDSSQKQLADGQDVQVGQPAGVDQENNPQNRYQDVAQTDHDTNLAGGQK